MIKIKQKKIEVPEKIDNSTLADQLIVSEEIIDIKIVTNEIIDYLKQQEEESEECSFCKGTGEVEYVNGGLHQCKNCNGTGRVKKESKNIIRFDKFDHYTEMNDPFHEKDKQLKEKIYKVIREQWAVGDLGDSLLNLFKEYAKK